MSFRVVMIARASRNTSSCRCLPKCVPAGEPGQLGDDRVGLTLATICRRLTTAAVDALDDLAAAGERGVGLLVELRADPGQPSVDTVLAGKLDRIRALGLPVGLFDGTPMGWSTRGGPGRPKPRWPIPDGRVR